MVELDKIDRRLLRILQEDNQLTNLELAEKAYLSPPTCLRRVRRLRAEKVILADVALLDPLVVGKGLFVFIEIILDRKSEAIQEAFEERMSRSPEVMQCYMVSGQTDFMIIGLVEDMASYHRFVRRALTNDPSIRNFRSVFAIYRSKFSTQIHLDEA